MDFKPKDKVKCLDTDSCDALFPNKIYTISACLESVQGLELKNEKLLLLEEIPYIAFSSIFFEKVN